MGIANKAISTKFLNIIIRTNHGQTEIVMQYGGLRSSVTCVTTSYSKNSFASPTHRTNQLLTTFLILSFCPFYNSETLITSFNMLMSRGSCLTRLSEPESHPCSASALLYHRISHQLNTIYRKHYRSCVTHLCTSGTASHKPLSNN
jgi:hypothetical protein